MSQTTPPGQVAMPIKDALARLTQLEQEGKLAEADMMASRMLAAKPDHPHIVQMAGIVSYRLGRIDEAIERMQKSESLAPDVSNYPRNICEVYRSVGRLDEALAAGLRAVALAPQEARAYFNLSLIYYERLELEEAVRVADQALALEPDYASAHFGKAESLLLAGRLAEGWESYEWRFKLKQAEGMLPKTDKPQWDGTPMEPGKLLIVGDQGFGDCIQFGRYIPWAAQIAPQPVVACSAELQPLLRQLPGIGKLATTWQAAAGFEAYIPISGLPRLAGARVDNILPAGYLAPPPARVSAWGERLERLVPRGKKRIALVWAGRPTHKNDRKRTLKLAAFAPLFARDDLAILTVQKGDQIAQAGSYYGHAPLVNLGPEINDFLDTMAILKHVDRLVTIDTSVAHVAGASNVPTSVLLPRAPDWRWLLNREDTPWYASLKLYRQTAPCQWDDVLQRVVADL